MLSKFIWLWFYVKLIWIRFYEDKKGYSEFKLYFVYTNINLTRFLAKKNQRNIQDICLVSWRFWGLWKSSIDCVHMLHSTINRANFSWNNSLIHSIIQHTKLERKRAKVLKFYCERQKFEKFFLQASALSFCQISKSLSLILFTLIIFECVYCVYYCLYLLFFS